MSEGILKMLHPVARRRHRCGLCECMIEKGQRYERERSIANGSIYDFVCHEECSKLAKYTRFQITWEGCSDANSFQDGLARYNEDNNHLEWNVLDLYDQVKLVLEEIINKGEIKE